MIHYHFVLYFLYIQPVKNNTYFHAHLEVKNYFNKYNESEYEKKISSELLESFISLQKETLTICWVNHP